MITLVICFLCTDAGQWFTWKGQWHIESKHQENRIQNYNQKIKKIQCTFGRKFLKYLQEFDEWSSFYWQAIFQSRCDVWMILLFKNWNWAWPVRSVSLHKKIMLSQQAFHLRSQGELRYYTRTYFVVYRLSKKKRKKWNMHTQSFTQLRNVHLYDYELT